MERLEGTIRKKLDFRSKILTNSIITRMKKLFFWALAACALAACSDDDPVNPTPPDPPTPDPTEKTEVVDFEAAELGEAGFLWGKELATPGKEQFDPEGDEVPSTYFWGTLYTEKQVRVQSYYTTYGNKKDTEVWNGFVISNHTDRTTAGYENDKSVYAESGAGGSKQFAVGYYGKETLRNRGVPTVLFRTFVKPVSVMVANATYSALYYNALAGTKPACELEICAKSNREELGAITVSLVTDGRMAEGDRKSVV